MALEAAREDVARVVSLAADVVTDIALGAKADAAAARARSSEAVAALGRVRVALREANEAMETHIGGAGARGRRDMYVSKLELEQAGKRASKLADELQKLSDRIGVSQQ